MGKNPPANEGDVDSIPGLEDLEKEMITHSRYSWLGNPMDRGDDGLQFMGSQKSRTRLSD